MAFCTLYVNIFSTDQDVRYGQILSGEAHFHLLGHVSKQNFPYQGDDGSGIDEHFESRVSRGPYFTFR
jgi:hypothetical protein